MRFVNKVPEVIIILLIFSAAFIIRSYGLENFLFFGYEQGRDAEIIKNIYTLKDFTLTGPHTSIPGLFHGPWYYYMMTIPYFLSSGNPLVAALFLALVGAITPVVIYFLIKDITSSKLWALFAAAVATLSYEYTLYSRWISNVSPAVPFIALAFWMLWKFIRKFETKYLVLFALAVALASSFQMILLPQFIFVIIVLALTKNFKISLRQFTLSLLALAVVFAPLLLFDFRNQHITINSVKNFISGSHQETTDSNIPNSIYVLKLQYIYHFQRWIIFVENNAIILFSFFTILFGLFLVYKQEKNLKLVIFLLSWIAMVIPLILIGPGNPQYYLAPGLGWVCILTLSLRAYLKDRRTISLFLAISLLVILSWHRSLHNLINNIGIFYRTVQDDLNYADQKGVLNFIHADAAGENYRFIAFTIPALHPEGWQYLHKYFYPNHKEEDPKLIYIVIEKKVDKFWEDRWIKDLGATKLISENLIGQLRIQKRIY